MNPEPGLRLDPERNVSDRHCDQCGRTYLLVKGFIYRDEVPYAIYFAACHDHDNVRETWIDLVLGTFGEGDWSDHITFGVRVGPVEGQVEAATLVQGAIPYGDAPIFGTRLSRDEGLVHPRLPECWSVIDFVLLEDVTVNHHLCGS